MQIIADRHCQLVRVVTAAGKKIYEWMNDILIILLNDNNNNYDYDYDEDDDDDDDDVDCHWRGKFYMIHCISHAFKGFCFYVPLTEYMKKYLKLYLFLLFLLIFFLIKIFI